MYDTWRYVNVRIANLIATLRLYRVPIRYLTLPILLCAMAACAAMQGRPDEYDEWVAKYRAPTRMLSSSARVPDVSDAQNCIESIILAGVVPGGLASEEGAKLVTGWSVRKGKTLGIWKWRKQWQERERFTITFYATPNGRAEASMDVVVELEERPNDHYEWMSVAAERKTHADDRATWAMQRLLHACLRGN